MLRPATEADGDAVAALGVAEEVAWFGEAESSQAEVLGFVADRGGVAAGVVCGDGGVSGFAVVSPDGDALMFVAADGHDRTCDELLPWLREQRARQIEVYAGDAARIAALERHGFEHTRSAFDLLRPGGEALGAPDWPAGVAVAAHATGDDDEGVHHLIYVDAAWGEIPGHKERSLEAWRSMFATDCGWLARRDGRAVGWVAGRLFANGHGWITQIAVAREDRRAGLGRALLLHACAELLARGATALGLSVVAMNEGAIGLYRSVGFEVAREWRVFAPARGRGAT